MKFYKQKKAFTLVELIIVIAIIAILAVTAFLVLTKWLASSRDSRRLNDLSVIHTALQTSYVDIASYPAPDDGVTVKYTETVGTLSTGYILGIQGEIGANDIKTLNLKGDMKDPSDADYYTYFLGTGGSKYSLMAMMEGDTYNVAYKAYNPSPIYAVDYSTRYPRVEGDKLGVLTTSTKTPLEKSMSSGTFELSGMTIVGNYYAWIDSSLSNRISTGFSALRVGSQGAYGLQAFYTFSGASEKFDSSAYGRTFSTVGTLAASGTKVGSAATVTAAATPATVTGFVDTTKPYTVMGWANVSSTMSGVIVTQGTGFRIQVAGSKFGFAAANSMTTYAFITGDTMVDGWHHFTMVVDPLNQQMTAYVDGAKKDAVSGIFNGTMLAGTLFQLSHASNSVLPPVTFDEIRVYNRTWSADEVKIAYMQEK